MFILGPLLQLQEKDIDIIVYEEEEVEDYMSTMQWVVDVSRMSQHELDHVNHWLSHIIHREGNTKSINRHVWKAAYAQSVTGDTFSVNKPTMSNCTFAP